MPILLRTVAPRPAGGSPPIQLPMAPLPKSALNNAGDKKSEASAKAIQVLLPKSPLPPQSGIINVLLMWIVMNNLVIGYILHIFSAKPKQCSYIKNK